MYHSKFAADIENMLVTLRNGGLRLMEMDYFLVDFDRFCTEKYPDVSTLTSEVAEKWIHNATTDSKAHMSRRVNAMKHLGRYQLSLGKAAYIPAYTIRRARAEEPRLFSDGQLSEFFERVDTHITTTPTYPYNDVIYPVMFRLIYCCGLRSSEACNLRVEDIDLAQGTLAIYRSKGFRDRLLHMSDDIWELCLRFHEYYSKIIPARTYFFQPSPVREHFVSYEVGKVFDSMLKKTTFSDAPGKKFTTHGLRHLFAVQNIKRCAELSEDFANWIQYLCKYMGHKNSQNTMYYLHITSQLFPVYSEKLRLLEEGVGVMYAED